MGKIVQDIVENRLVIWQGDLDEVSMGHLHRVIQIAADDCIVEYSVGNPTNTDSWKAEDDDNAVANTYMRALLATRALL